MQGRLLPAYETEVSAFISTLLDKDYGSIDELETDIDNVSQLLQAAALKTLPKFKPPKDRKSVV